MSDELMMTQCGTPGYVAPEVIFGRGYDIAVDYWSVGVILYVLLCGFPPFYEEDTDKLYEQIKAGRYDFPSPYFDDVSDLAKDLIRKLLVVDPRRRFKAEEILSHPWIIGDVTPRKNLPQVLPGIKSYNAKKRFKRVGEAVRAVSKFASFVEKRKTLYNFKRGFLPYYPS
eukprot:TRINITY_DN6676_c0_g1_i12.p1 TRINITY_DN6676_c0_g1~~TRINITY_DN6676_c0_g1_i12.p1  ORF type:complete len:170 (+),score=43.44 TRINITY_DN6676_c0_g1_i12:645-1154(+)